MFKVNQYFEGKVMSLGFNTEECPATIGVMASGEYEFGTSSVEYMTVTSGTLEVMLPGENTWKSYPAGQTFIVPANVKFRVVAKMPVSYLCLYK